MILGATALLALATVPAVAQDSTPSWRDRVTFSLSNRVRGEFVDWFGPPAQAPDGTPIAPGVERYNFFANRFRAGVRALLPPVELNLQFQYTELANVPENASLPRRSATSAPGRSTSPTHTTRPRVSRSSSKARSRYAGGE